MDWLTVATSVGSSLVGGGLIAGLVALRVSRHESSDRQAALALEREKWDATRRAEVRSRLQPIYTDTVSDLTEMQTYIDLLSWVTLPLSTSELGGARMVSERLRKQINSWSAAQYPAVAQSLTEAVGSLGILISPLNRPWDSKDTTSEQLKALKDERLDKARAAIQDSLNLVNSTYNA